MGGDHSRHGDEWAHRRGLPYPCRRHRRKRRGGHGLRSRLCRFCGAFVFPRPRAGRDILLFEVFRHYADRREENGCDDDRRHPQILQRHGVAAVYGFVELLHERGNGQRDRARGGVLYHLQRSGRGIPDAGRLDKRADLLQRRRCARSYAKRLRGCIGRRNTRRRGMAVYLRRRGRPDNRPMGAAVSCRGRDCV